MSDSDPNTAGGLSGGFDLGAFLASQQAEGVKDSDGEITLSQDKARQKLTQFSLSTSYAWLLKVIQAVVLWDCEELRVTQTRISTAFFFQPRNRFPSERGVVEALQRGVANKDDPTGQICIALRSLVEQTGLSFVLSIHDEEPSAHPIYSGEDVGKLSERERMKWAKMEERGVRLTVSHFKGRESFTGRVFPTFTQVERRDMKITSVLQENVLFCPVPVVLDGRLLNCPMSHPKHGFSFRGRPIILTGLRSDDFPRLLLAESFEEKLMSLDTTPARAARSYHGVRDFSVWYCISARHPSNMRLNMLLKKPPTHEILWIKDGVVVERSRAEGNTDICSLKLFLSAADFGTDMSGLSLIRNEERQELQQKIVRAVGQDISQRFCDPAFLERDDRDEYSERESDYSKDPRHDLLKHNIYPSLGLGLVAGITAPLAAPGWVIGGAVAGLSALAGTLAKRYQDSEPQQAKRRALWLETVTSDLSKLGEVASAAFKADRSTLTAASAPEELFRPRQR